MTQQRKITDELDARRCLAAARGAGEDAGRWARAHGVDGRSLNAWRMNLARRGTGREKPVARPPRTPTIRPRAALVELVPAPRPVAAARYTVRIGEIRVELSDDFDATTLRRILEVLRTC